MALTAKDLIDIGATYMAGFRLGRFVTSWGDVKLGKVAWSKVEDSTITTLYDFCDGFRDGREARRETGTYTLTGEH